MRTVGNILVMPLIVIIGGVCCDWELDIPVGGIDSACGSVEQRTNSGRLIEAVVQMGPFANDCRTTEGRAWIQYTEQVRELNSCAF
jgi:hypothetical protein